MKNIKSAFRGSTISLALAQLVPTRKLTNSIRKTKKYQTIRSSLRELGLIEPLAVFPEHKGLSDSGSYFLLDGHLRLHALKELGVTHAVCLISTDDEAFTYNRQLNRLTTIQEHKMVLKAIEKGVSPERIAAVLDVDVNRIRFRQHLLDGIAPEVSELLKNRMVGQAVFGVLRKMKPIRQIEATEMMISANKVTSGYAKMILATTRQELLSNPKFRKKAEGVSPEDFARMEREMEKLNSDYKLIEETHGETMLVLVVAKGYVKRLVQNATIQDYLSRHYPEIARELLAAVEVIGGDNRATQSY